MERVIRAWELEDAENLAVALNDKAIMDNLRDGLPYPYTSEDARSFISSMLAAEPDTVYPYAIVAGDQAIGSIAVFRCGNIHRRTAELGYYLARPYWGQGIGTEAVKQISRFVFEHTDIVRIFAEPFATNAGSCRILEKAGYELEGVLRKNAVKNGEIIDMKMYSLVK